MSDRHLIIRKGDLIELLELICQSLELTEAQHERIVTHYQSVAEWLDECEQLSLFLPEMYPQGSMRIGTTVKPFGREVFDLDFVCNLAKGQSISDPRHLKELVGKRLRAHGTYGKMLSEKGRCWRLDYSDSEKFHMDITPAIPADRQLPPSGYLLVPDREVQMYKDSAPKNYANWFLEIAERLPLIRTLAAPEGRIAANRADIEPLPDNQQFKKPLQRIVQIFKRHRSIYFNGHRDAPISIIITTLVSHAYAEQVRAGAFDTHYDLLINVARSLPDFIEKVGGLYRIKNPVLRSENFAEKWNTHPNRAIKFFEWQHQLVDYLEDLLEPKGMDRLKKGLTGGFGQHSASKAFSEYEKRRDTLMQGKTGIGILPGSGITVASSPAKAHRPTFYGA